MKSQLLEPCRAGQTLESGPLSKTRPKPKVYDLGTAFTEAKGGKDWLYIEADREEL